MFQSTRNNNRRNIILNFVRWMLWNGYRLRTERKHIQGDQKVSVHLMIQIHKVTSNIRSVSGQSPDIYWHSELYSRRPWSIYRGPHSECILWWPASTHKFCGDFSDTLSFSSHPTGKSSGRERSGDFGGQMILQNNSVHKHVVQDCHRHMRCVSYSTIMKGGFVNCISFQLRNEGTHNGVTVPFTVESVRGKKCIRICPTWHSNPNTNLPIILLANL